MEEQLVKKSYDVQSLILCSIISLLIIVPIALFTINYKNVVTLIILIVFIALTIISQLLIYFHTMVQIIFKKSEIIFMKKNKELKRFKWHEIKIEYLGFEELFFLKCFCIQLSYYDRKKEAIYVFGISLWGDALPKMMRFIEDVADEMKDMPEEVLCG